MLILHDSKSTVRLTWFTQPIKASCVHWLSQVVAAIIYFCMDVGGCQSIRMDFMAAGNSTCMYSCCLAYTLSVRVCFGGSLLIGIDL